MNYSDLIARYSGLLDAYNFTNLPQAPLIAADGYYQISYTFLTTASVANLDYQSAIDYNSISTYSGDLANLNVLDDFFKQELMSAQLDAIKARQQRGYSLLSLETSKTRKEMVVGAVCY